MDLMQMKRKGTLQNAGAVQGRQEICRARNFLRGILQVKKILLVDQIKMIKMKTMKKDSL